MRIFCLLLAASLAGCASDTLVRLPDGRTGYEAYCQDADFSGCRREAFSRCGNSSPEIREHHYPTDEDPRYRIVYTCLRPTG